MAAVAVMGDEQVARIATVDDRVDQLGPRLVQQPMLFADNVNWMKQLRLAKIDAVGHFTLFMVGQSDGKDSSTLSSAQSHPVERSTAGRGGDGGFLVVNKRLVEFEAG